MAQGYGVRLESRDICDDVATFRFTRPDGYDFVPGQWFRLTLDTAEGPQAKTFSHASAPRDDYLELATRLSGSAYKTALSRLEVGGEASIAGPGGRRLIAEDTDKVVFIVGGVGITPARCILRDAAQASRRFEDALVLYGDRDERCVAFLDELAAMQDIGVRVVLCLEAPPSGWEGERGFITSEVVKRHIDEVAGRAFLVSGPPVMVEVMEAVLDEIGVAPEMRVVERFGPKTALRGGRVR